MRWTAVRVENANDRSAEFNLHFQAHFIRLVAYLAALSSSFTG